MNVEDSLKKVESAWCRYELDRRLTYLKNRKLLYEDSVLVELMGIVYEIPVLDLYTLDLDNDMLRETNIDDVVYCSRIGVK